MGHAIEVARHGDTVYARIVGLGNFNNAGPFKEFVDAMIQNGVRTVLIDMKDCAGLDSTFMGTMASFLSCPLSVEGASQSMAGSAVRVTIVNQTPPTERAMKSLGLPAILDVRNDPVEVPQIKLERLREEWIDANKRVELIKKAHEKLVEIDKTNEAKFGPFLAMLLKDMEKKEGE